MESIHNFKIYSSQNVSKFHMAYPDILYLLLATYSLSNILSFSGNILFNLGIRYQRNCLESKYFVY